MTAPAPETWRPAGARRARLGVAAAAVTLLLAGCGGVLVRYPDGTTEYQTREAFTAYVQRVFRYQNRVENDLIVATSFTNTLDPADPELQRAEQRMTRACRVLNEAVSASIEGRGRGLLERLRLPGSVPECEAASRRLARMIPDR